MKNKSTSHDTVTASPSPLLSRLVTDEKKVKALAASNITSVFDIAQMPREQFAKLYETGSTRSASEKSEMGLTYERAVSYANQLLQLSRRLLQDPNRSSLKSEGMPGVLALRQDGPTYPQQFPQDFQNKCKPGAIESTMSPVHYLVYLYKIAQDLEKIPSENQGNRIKLDTRRSDLPELFLDEQHTYQEIPALSLVIDSIDKLIKQQREKGTINDVDLHLTEVRYPFALPFDLWMKQIRLILQEHGTDLGNIIHQADRIAPYFISEQTSPVLQRALLTSNQISEEEYRIINDSEPSSDQENQFIEDNFGVKQDEPIDYLKDVSKFLQSTSLSGDELDALFSQGNYKPKQSSAINSEIRDLRTVYGSAYINAGGSPVISSSNGEIFGFNSVTPLWRINKLIRLQRWTSVAFAQIDWLIRAATQEEDIANLALDDRSLRAIGLFKRWRNRYRIQPESFSALIWQICPYAAGNDTPFYDQLFGARGGAWDALPVDGVSFEYANSTDLSVQQLCAGLRITAEELALVGPLVEKAYPINGLRNAQDLSGQLQRTLPVFSALYRLVALPRMLGYSVPEGQALLRILASTNNSWLDTLVKATPYRLNQPNFADILSAMLGAEALADWLKSRALSPLSVEQMLGLSQDRPVETEELVRFAQELALQVESACLSDERFNQIALPKEELPDTDGKRRPIHWMDQLEMLVDEQGLIKPIGEGKEQKNEKTIALLENDNPANWHTLPGYDPAYAIKSLHFFDQDNGWAKAQKQDGAIDIIQSVDGGVTWSKIDLAENQVFEGSRVFAKEADECWCVAARLNQLGPLLQIKAGKVYPRKKVDAELDQKSSKQNETADQLYDVCFFANNGWAVGEKSTVLKSTDGGKTWNENEGIREIDSNVTLRRVTFSDAENGWAGGENTDGIGKIYTTENGGANWTESSPYDPASCIDHLDFIDAENGWARARVGSLNEWNTALHLNQAKSEEAVTIKSLHFFDRRRGWAKVQTEDNTIQIQQTQDGGQSWALVQEPAEKNLPIFYDSSVFAKAKDECWCVGDALGQLIQISDGQKTAHLVMPGVRLYDLCFVDDTGWAVGAKGTVLKSTNGGTLWEPQPSPNAAATFRRVFFLDQQNGWIGCNDGQVGAVYRTTDGGQTWTTRSQDIASCIDHLGFVDEQVGWARAVHRHQDQWQLLPSVSQADTAIKHLHFLDEKHGWALSYKDEHTVSIIKTADGGQNWETIRNEAGEPIEMPSIWPQTRLFARSVDECWCIGRDENTLIQMIVDTPAINVVTVEGGGRLRDVCFIGETGWAVGDAGAVLKSEDGGQNWSQQTNDSFDSTATLWRVVFQNERWGWIGGEEQGQGIVYRTEDGGANWTPHVPLERAARIDHLHFVDSQNGWARAQVGQLGQWRALPNDYDQDSTIKSLHFVDHCHGWASARQSDDTIQILRTMDHGVSWSEVNTPAVFNRSRVFARERDECWCIGNELGQLIQIEGEQAIVHSVPAGRLYDLCFAGNTGWAVGAQGVLLRSEDSGRTWDREPSPSELDVTLFCVDFIDADHGWIAGRTATSGVVYSTSDGGETWYAKALEGTSRLDHLHFIDRQTGWVSAVTGQQAQWDALPTLDEKVTVERLHFIDEKYGWAMLCQDNEKMSLVRTVQGGQRWEVIQTEDGKPVETLGLWPDTRLFARGVNECWCIGQADNTLIRITGATGRAITVSEGGRLRDVCFAGHTGWAVGDGGVLLKSDDDGQTWIKQTFISPTATLWRVTFQNDRWGWIGGEDQGQGVVYRTQDGGCHWSREMPLDEAVRVDHLQFVDTRNGWGRAVKKDGSYASIVYTRDGGRQWKERPLPTPGNQGVKDFDFIDAKYGWATTGHKIFQTVNSGRSWEEQPTSMPDKTQLSSVSMADASHGWMGGSAGCLLAMGDSEGACTTIHHTTDAGQTWRSMEAAGLEGTIHGMTFTDADHGWLVGEGGSIFQTSDAGQSWSFFRNPLAGTSLWSVFMLDASHGWIGGSARCVLALDDCDAHALMRTPNGGITWQEQAIPALCDGPIHDVAFVDPLNGWLIGEGTVLRTTDGGNQWTRLPMKLTQPGLDLWSVSMIDVWRGWIGGAAGMLLTTEDALAQTLMCTWDGGTTWQAQAIPDWDERPIHDVVFRKRDDDSSIDGWLLSTKGSMLHTTDGGEHWSPIVLPEPFANLDWWALSILDADYGWIGGAAGQLLTGSVHRLLKTNDGGAKWTPLDTALSPGQYALIHDMKLTGAGQGWVVSANGMLGQVIADTVNWRCIVPPLSSDPRQDTDLSNPHEDNDLSCPYQDTDLSSINFYDASHGWVGGDRGCLFKNFVQGSGMAGQVWAVLAQLDLSPEDREKGFDILTALLDDAQTTQDNCAYMAISKLFGSGPRQVPWIFNWMGESVHTLLSASLNTLARQEAGSAPSGQPNDYADLLYKISHYALALNVLQLSDAALQRLIPYPKRVTGQSLCPLPLTLASLYPLSRIRDWMAQASQPEDMFLRYIETANAYDAYGDLKQKCVELLATLTHWDAASIETLFADAVPCPFPNGFVQDLVGMDWIWRCKGLSDTYGLSASIALCTRSANASYPVMDDYRITASALIAQHNQEAKR